jgi:hypothetical protein
LQVTICRGEHAHIHLEPLRTSDSFELALLEQAQQRDLHLRRKLADLIEKDRAAIRGLEAPRMALDRGYQSAVRFRCQGHA